MELIYDIIKNLICCFLVLFHLRLFGYILLKVLFDVWYFVYIIWFRFVKILNLPIYLFGGIIGLAQYDACPTFHLNKTDRFLALKLNLIWGTNQTLCENNNVVC